MHQELIRELSVITEEERRILEGRKEIDQQIYTEKKDMVIDSKKASPEGEAYSGAAAHTVRAFSPTYAQLYRSDLYVPGQDNPYPERKRSCS